MASPNISNSPLSKQKLSPTPALCCICRFSLFPFPQKVPFPFSPLTFINRSLRPVLPPLARRPTQWPFSFPGSVLKSFSFLLVHVCFAPPFFFLTTRYHLGGQSVSKPDLFNLLLTTVIAFPVLHMGPFPSQIERISSASLSGAFFTHLLFLRWRLLYPLFLFLVLEKPHPHSVRRPTARPKMTAIFPYPFTTYDTSYPPAAHGPLCPYS